MIDRTRIRSDTPGSPGWMRARAADDQVDVDAGTRRAVERLDDRDVDDRVELEDDPRRAPGRGVADLALDEVEEPRAQAVRRDEQPPERPLARQPGQVVEQVRDVRPELRPAGQQAEVDIQPRRLRVVVAGPDVDVAAQPGALAPDDERRLRVRLEPDQPVHDVGPGALQLARPDDVGLFVEARLDLDQDDDLLAALGRPDQRLDDGRVARRSVQRLLDGQDVGVVGRLGDEPLGRGRERLVRMVDEDVAGADRGEHVGRLVVVRRQEPRRRDRRPGHGLEIGPVELGDRPQSGQVEHAADVVAVGLGQTQAALQQGAGRRRHRALDLEPDGRPEAAAAELLLDGEQQVVRLVLLDLEVGVAGDPEEVVLLDLHAREQRVEVGLDDLVDEHEVRRPDLEQARQDLRHLDPREAALARLRVAQPDRDRQAQRRDVRERVARIDRERREDREDLVEEALAERVVVLRDRRVLDQLDALRGERPADVHEDRRVVGDELEHALARGRELFLGGPAVGRAGDLAGLDLLAQAGHAHLEELVEVAREDRQELDPLEQRVALVARLVQHPRVEFEPRQLAVDVGERDLGTRRRGADARRRPGVRDGRECLDRSRPWAGFGPLRRGHRRAAARPARIACRALSPRRRTADRRSTGRARRASAGPMSGR